MIKVLNRVAMVVGYVIIVEVIGNIAVNVYRDRKVRKAAEDTLDGLKKAGGSAKEAVKAAVEVPVTDVQAK